MALRPYQEANLEALVKARADGLTRVLAKAPTGTGKTVTFAELLKRFRPWLETFPESQRRMLVVAHREELLDQALDKIQRANPGLMISIEQGDRHANSYSDVVIASIQTLAARKFTRLHRLLRRHTFRLVVIDEAHHAAAPTYRTLLAHLGFLPTTVSSESGETEAATYDDVKVMAAALEGWDAQAPKDRFLVGVTATPNRTDAIGLGCVFQSIAYSYALKDAINDQWLVPIKPWVIETTDNLDSVRTTAGEFNQKDLAETVNNPRRNRLAVDGWKLYAGDRPTLAFTVDVKHAHDLADEFRRAGIAALPLSGETPKDERRQMLADYTAGHLQVITNCMVLTEGTDLPRTSCILHAKPTKSATLYEQMTGRGLRLFPEKTDCIVIDVVDVARRHSLQTAPILYGLPPGILMKGDDLRKTEAEIDELRAKMDVEQVFGQGKRFTVQELLDRASTFDVWTVAEKGPIAEGLTLNWLRVGLDSFRLSYPWQAGLETLEVVKNLLGHYDLSLTFRPQEKSAVPRQRTIAAEIVSAQAALTVAEAFVRQERQAITRLKGKEAEWRSKGPSPAAIGYAKKLGVVLNGRKWTAGEISDAIDRAKAMRGW
jgi:superfamily II DNA or RNA helicase